MASYTVFRFVGIAFRIFVREKNKWWPHALLCLDVIKPPELLLLGDGYIHWCKRQALKFPLGWQEYSSVVPVFVHSFEVLLVQASLCYCVLYHFGQLCLIEQYHHFWSPSPFLDQGLWNTVSLTCNFQLALLHSAHWKLLIICHKKCSVKKKCWNLLSVCHLKRYLNKSQRANSFPSIQSTYNY